MNESADNDNNFKFLLETLSEYQIQKKENDAIINQLEKMMHNLADIYKIDYESYSLENVQNNNFEGKDLIEQTARDYIKTSNENYNLLRNIQLQLVIRDKLFFIINDFNEVIVYLQKHIQNNMKNFISQNKEQEIVLKKAVNDVTLLNQINEYNGKINFKDLYLKIAKDIEEIIDTLK